MMHHIKKSLFIMPALAGMMMYGSLLQAQDGDGDQRSDAVEYDLFDRMRSGRVFHDRSYPDPDRNYYCPQCGAYHEYKNTHNQTAETDNSRSSGARRYQRR